jgi:phage recombination protein Bet
LSEIITYNQEQIELIKNTICKGASTEELKLFCMQCARTGLDPFARQIYSIERGGRRSMQISIDGARLIAERSGHYAGQLGPHWTGMDGTWIECWLKKEAPAAARVAVLRHDFKEPLWAIANFDAYNAKNNMWQKFPALMIAKCAEMLALRRGFPQELSGLYSQEEMSQSDDIIDVPKQVEHKVEHKTELLNLTLVPHRELVRVVLRDLNIANNDISAKKAEIETKLNGIVPYNYKEITTRIKEIFNGN